MTSKVSNGLMPLNLLVIALVAAVVLSLAEPWRIICGIPFALYFLGYTLMLALLPAKEGTGGAGRVVLNFVLNMAVMTRVTLLLSCTRWWITLESMLYLQAPFTFLMSIIAWGRIKKLRWKYVE